MIAIWKFPLEVKPSQTIEMPIGADLLYVDQQNGQLCLWASVDTEVPTEKVTFRVYGTGQEIKGEEGLHYLGTTLAQGFVWHVFEELFS